jgi:predicted GNAT superfamily acetyltransferase
MAVHIRDLHSLDDFRAVVALEQEIWGYSDLGDVVTVPVFIITVKRGGILIGAFDDDGRMVGFAFSLVGIKNGKPTQWSHMMGVVTEHRRTGLGRALKMAHSRVLHPPRSCASGCSAKGRSATRSDSQRSNG